MRYRLASATGEVLDEGEGRAEVVDGALVVSPALGQPLRVRPRDVAALDEPEPYVVALRLREGPVLTLLQMGALRTQVLADFARQRADDLSSALLLAGIGRPESFTGAVGGVDAELRLYDDAFVALPAAGEPVQVPYSFVESVETDASGYRIEVGIGEDAPLVVQRLARRTSEFLDLLRSRVTASRGRTSAFVGALLPGLGPVTLRSAAGLLRDGVAASRASLDGIDTGIWPGLVASVATADRLAGVEHLSRLGEAHLGFHQLVSVERSAQGATGWAPTAPTVVTDHDRTTGGLGTGIGGALTAGAFGDAPSPDAFGQGFGGQLGSMAALSMLGLMPGLGSSAGDRQAAPRADVERSTLTPPGTDLAALTAAGDAPTVLAFLVVQTGARTVVEVLNEPDHATFVFASGPDGLRRLNRGLALLHFQVSAVTAEAGLSSRYAAAIERLEHLRALRSALVGRAIHTDGWRAQLDRLLRG